MLQLSNLLLIILVLLSIISIVLSQSCPNSCSKRGRCNKNTRQCTCFEGYTGADCSLYVCPYGIAWTDQSIGIDNAHKPAECSNMGICDRKTGNCACRSGFEGQACDRMSCPSNCNGNGKCEALYYYANSKDLGTGPLLKYVTPWDAYKIQGCNCNVDWFGPACDQRKCPFGDDPMTGNGANTVTNPIQYNEQQKLICKAGGGSFTVSFRGETTVPIAFNAKLSTFQAAFESLKTVGSGNTIMTLINSASQMCSDTGNTVNIVFQQNFGSLPLIVPNFSRLFFRDAILIASVVASKVVDGSKENAFCSNRGICDPSTGICTCSTNYDTSNGYQAAGTRGDCGRPTATIQTCPGATVCSGHGSCAGNPTFRCTCFAGFQGADCSQRTCPRDVSWFTLPTTDNVAHISESVECSDMGVCDRSAGKCTCVPGYSGQACQTFNCVDPTCSGHGTCLTMKDLAKQARVNGVLPNPLFDYGSIPNNPMTWDANKIKGCLCDTGYSGYDCSLRVCATGDDPDTHLQNDELQVITCRDVDAAGSIILSFKEEKTVSLPATSSSATVRAALQNLFGIGVVTVQLYNTTTTDTLCSRTGFNQMSIQFNTEHGNLPMLVAISTGIDSITITEAEEGTKEQITCSGRGICNEVTGLCTCFRGYSSSNGMGGMGTINDCGYVEPAGTTAATS